MKWEPVRLSPVEYVNEVGILKQINQIISEKNYLEPVILTDDRVIQVSKSFLPNSFYEHHRVIIFKGHATYAEIDRIVSLLESADVLVALGGGQLLDTAKSVVNKGNIDFINIPTIASNCAAITTKSMIYSEENHELVGRQRHNKPVQLVLVDPLLLKHTPTSYLLSGIGDTLAKYYEIRRRLYVPEAQGAVLDIARTTIEIAKERTLEINDLNQIDDQTFVNLLDTIFLVAASVDGFAATRGRSVAAHSFHNGYLKAIDHPAKTHGEIVAFGILVQLAIENEKAELAKMKKFYQTLGLPTQLADLHLSAQTETIHIIAKSITASDNDRIQTVYHNLTEQTVYAAINSLAG
ncbi:iron-containing alcohol dehydrogenase family protein [Leuconostoc rapi]|uniref:iron-containing alcohol dehydrogenase family protein n=1 Tax=Leuconostoc rapi TaxID=1406906 RepID=UPI001956B3E7|nr:iron-containing alcohol dehydrogenase family protein [Leuconostoc rapi]MBM7436517.1 putative oxidoreductase [Leuconostoc rapi]